MLPSTKPISCRVGEGVLIAAGVKQVLSLAVTKGVALWATRYVQNRSLLGISGPNTLDIFLLIFIMKSSKEEKLKD